LSITSCHAILSGNPVLIQWKSSQTKLMSNSQSDYV
jgi:hypothetical protein